MRNSLILSKKEKFLLSVINSPMRVVGVCYVFLILAMIIAGLFFGNNAQIMKAIDAIAFVVVFPILMIYFTWRGNLLHHEKGIPSRAIGTLLVSDESYKGLEGRINYWIRNYNSGSGMPIFLNEDVMQKIYEKKPISRKECSRLAHIVGIYSNMEGYSNGQTINPTVEKLAPFKKALEELADKLEVEDKNIQKKFNYWLKAESLSEEDDIFAKQAKIAYLNIAVGGLAAISALCSAVAAFLTLKK